MSAPRLNTIDGMALGQALMSAYLLQQGFMWRPTRPIVENNLTVRAVDDLVQYAQGVGKLDRLVLGYIENAMPILKHPLCPSTLPPIISKVTHAAIDPDSLTKGDPIDELALVIAAALGRQALDREQHIRASWLAAYCSCSLKTVERAKLKRVRRGADLGWSSGWTTSKAARAWIVARKERVVA